MKIIKEEFLKDEAVSGFIENLAKLINGEKNSFLHCYQNRQSHKNWACNSLQDALLQYCWKKKSFTETKEELDSLKVKLCNSFELNNESEFKDTCHDILKWGGVLQHNTEWLENKINSENGLIKAFANAKDLLTKDLVSIDPKDWNNTGQQGFSNYRMNAGYTKIFSLLCENFIIYDSRVAAALGKLVVKYLLENENINFSSLDNLKFGYMPAKEDRNCKLPKNRDPSHLDVIMFKRMNNSGSLHAEWNVKANWILSDAIEQADMQWIDNQGDDIEAKDRLRALEAALFMIGYDLPDLNKASASLTNIKPKKVKVPKIDKQKEMTKKQKAIQIFNRHESKSRAKIIDLFMHEVNLTKAGASTYYQYCKTIWQ